MSKPVINHKITNDETITTRYVLGGKTVNENAKQLLVDLLEFYVLKLPKPVVSDKEVARKEYIEVLTEFVKSGKKTYKELTEWLETEDSFECTLAYVLVAFMTPDPMDLLHMFCYTFSRPLPLNGQTEWMDNFRINSSSYALNMIVYNSFDNNSDESVYSLGQPAPFQGSDSEKYDLKKLYALYQQKNFKSDINRTVMIDFHRLYKFMVNPLRGFIMQRELFGKENIKTAEGLDLVKCEILCDLCYLMYPFVYSGAHGCDVFSVNLSKRFETMSLNLDEIKLMLNRYPNLTVMYVLNTAMYTGTSGGKHWVPFIMKSHDTYLICSQGGGYNIFDNKELPNILTSMGLRQNHNGVSIQTDSFNCGIYSPLVLMVFPLTNYDISKTVRTIGNNGENLGIFSKNKEFVDINTFRMNLIGSANK